MTDVWLVFECMNPGQYDLFGVFTTEALANVALENVIANGAARHNTEIQRRVLDKYGRSPEE